MSLQDDRGLRAAPKYLGMAGPGIEALWAETV